MLVMLTGSVIEGEQQLDSEQRIVAPVTVRANTDTC